MTSITSMLPILLGWADVARADDCVNPLKDPGYEQRIPAEQGGWTRFGGKYTSSQVRSGETAMFHTATYDTTGAFQQLPATAGSKWQLTGYGLTPLRIKGAAFGIVQVSFFDANGKDLGSVETAGRKFPAKTSNPVDISAPPGEWIRLDTGVATAPAGTAFIQAFTLFVDYTGNFQGVYFDDLALCAVGG